MKKLGILALVFALLFSLSACRRKEQSKPTETTPVTTAPSVIPEMDPTLETNIPDPTVDSNSTGIDGNTQENFSSNDVEQNANNTIGAVDGEPNQDGNGTSGSTMNGSTKSSSSNRAK